MVVSRRESICQKGELSGPRYGTGREISVTILEKLSVAAPGDLSPENCATFIWMKGRQAGPYAN